jgi:pimeloyl-ACP methyl ester carboxylesterase
MPALEGGTPRSTGSGSALWRWTKRGVLALVVLLVLLALTGLLYQYTLTRREARESPPPGKLIAVDGHQMHLYCTGTGSPTVVLESAQGGTWMDWALVQPEVAKFTRVCSYDRAGMGWSEPGPPPRVSSRIADELNTLLTQGGQQPPYILVGHSVGGYHVRVFCDRYPEKIAGVVLVEATHEELERLPPEIGQEIKEYARMIGRFKYAMYFGLPRLMGLCGQVPDPLSHLQEMNTYNQCRVSFFRTLEQELNGLEASAREVAGTRGLDDLPLIVVSRDYSEPEPGLAPDVSERARAVGKEMQEELSQLSSRGRLVTAAGSGHYVQWDRPEVVIQAIQEVTEEARGNSGS